MDVKNYKTFSLELGLKFANELSDEQVDHLFRKFVDIEEFNGLKKIDNEEDNTVAKLISSDDTLRLRVFNTDISLSLVDKKLANNIEDNTQKMLDVFAKVVDLMKEQKFEVMRANIITYSTSITDKAHVISELINEKYQSELDDFDIWLESKGETIQDTETAVMTSITNQHSAAIHTAFKSQGREKSLANLTVIHTACGLLENVNAEYIHAFAGYAMSGKLSKLSLDKLGYGKQ